MAALAGLQDRGGAGGVAARGERTDTELHLLQLIDPWPRPTPAKLTFAEATKTFAARSAEHCHSYDWFSFVARTNRKNNNSKESFVFVINENILNNSLGLN